MTFKRTLASNRRARRDYEISEKLEAGIVLSGTEVKSLRGGEFSLSDGYVAVRGAEAWLLGVYIQEYTHGNRHNHEPRRPRKLLLKRHEIERLRVRIQERGNSAIPLELYFQGPWIKVLIGVGKGRKMHDKRRAEKAKLDRKEMDQAR